MKTKAAVAWQAGKPLEIEQVDLEGPRAGEVLVFLLVCGLINFVGALVCGIGLFVTIPVTMIASGYAWRTLNGRPPALA